MAEDVFEILIHDEDGEILLHQQLTKEQAEQAILNFDWSKTLLSTSRRHLTNDKPYGLATSGR
jgi:hypothetical protein